MRIGLRKNPASRPQPAGLFDLCERLFTDNRSLVSEDHDGCADSILNLASPGGLSIYVLCRHTDGGTYYGLFPPEGFAGHGSFIYPGGKYTQHGRISPHDARLVITTFTPWS